MLYFDRFYIATRILIFDCVNFYLFELFSFKCGECFSPTEIFAISRIRREGYLSGLRDGWEQL